MNYRYVNDMFVVLKKDKIDAFIDHINNVELHIKFIEDILYRHDVGLSHLLSKK